MRASAPAMINGYFRTQPITGQQRYATEIADRLLRAHPDVAELRPGRRFASRYAQWAQLQVRVPMTARGRTLVSLTSRTPVLAERQVVTIHDLFPLTNPEWFEPAYAALHRRLLRHHLRRAAGIAVVSRPVLDEVRNLVHRDIPIALVPNASGLAPARGPAPRESRSRGYFLAVGSLEPRKNLARLLEAHSLLSSEVRSDFPLLVVGGTAAAFREEKSLRRLSASHVRLLGRVDDDALAELYAGCTAFVSTSLAEGFGIPIVEAASAGCRRMVLSDIPAYRWVTEGTRPEFVDPHSPESIAAGLLAVLESSDRCGGFEPLPLRFSWESSARAMASLVREVDDRVLGP